MRGSKNVEREFVGERLGTVSLRSRDCIENIIEMALNEILLSHNPDRSKSGSHAEEFPVCR